MDIHESTAYVLRRLAQRPAYLDHALEPERVMQALARQIPEVNNGSLRIVDLNTERLFLKDTSGRWTGVYRLVVEDSDSASRREVNLRVMLYPPDHPAFPQEMPSLQALFGEPGWQTVLPELGLHVALEPAEQVLEGFSLLTDPELSRDLLEANIRAGSAAHRAMQILASWPKILNYKPGSRCTIRYEIDVREGANGPVETTAVIGKTYRGNKGKQAYQGMVELWNSSLRAGDALRLAEPLAYVPEYKFMLQTQLPEEQTLERFYQAVLQQPSPEGEESLRRYLRMAGEGLAMLHNSGVQPDETVRWEDRFADLPDLIGRLGVVAPDLIEPLQQIASHLENMAADEAEDAKVASHGTFDADQVLIAEGKIGFIDFDSFCMAEPSMDLSHFGASLVDSGMKWIDSQASNDPQQCREYIDRLYALRDVFIREYEGTAVVSRQRLSAWDTLDYLRDALHLWAKPRRNASTAPLTILEDHYWRQRAA